MPRSRFVVMLDDDLAPKLRETAALNKVKPGELIALLTRAAFHKVLEAERATAESGDGGKEGTESTELKSSELLDDEGPYWKASTF